MSHIRPYVMHESGAIPGVPGPNGGLWPGGITVYVDEDLMEVVSTSLIGGSGTDKKPADAPAQAPKARRVAEQQKVLGDNQ